jgi:hypothetical protein
VTHVDDGTLNALLDGELDGAEAAAAQAHIAGCAECAKRLDEAKRFLAGAADLLGALEMPGPAAMPEAPPRRVTKTAKEVALEVDGATHQSPAVGAEPPERLWRRAPRSQPERRPFDYTSLAWAATIVLAIGVGYLGNEVRHAREGLAAGAENAASKAAAPAPANEKAVPVSTTRAGPVAAGGVPAASGQRSRGGPPAAKAPPGEGVPAVPGRSSTGLGHKRLEAPAQRAGGARVPVVRPNETADAVQPAPVAAGAAAPALRNAPDAPRPQPAAGAEGVNALAGASGAAARALATAPGAAPARDAFHRATLEQAVSRLQGTIRLIDGMRSDHVEIGPGRRVFGADSAHDVVRVVYGEAGQQIVLDQQRTVVPDPLAEERQDAQPSVGRMGLGDTVFTTAPAGQRRLRWLDRSGFWLSLTGRIPADSLRKLAGQVR